MFEPEGELVQSFQILLPSGERVVYDQSLWGKVIEVRELHLEGGRYFLDDYWATARLRQLLEISTLRGALASEAQGASDQEIALEVRNVIRRLYGEADEW